MMLNMTIKTWFSNCFGGCGTFQDRFDILLEMRLSGVAKRLIWEMSVLPVKEEIQSKSI